MLNPFSDSPTYRARLAGISRVDIHHSQSGTLRLVGHKVLQLGEGPAMQPCFHPLTCFDSGADIGQVFHADFACPNTDSFCNDGFAGFVVDVPDMSLFTPGDSAQLSLGCTATVGLEATTMGKVFVAVMPQLSATKHLSSAGCSEVVLPNINPKSTTGNRRDIGQVENKIEIPDAFFDNKSGFFRLSVGEKIELMLSANKWNVLASAQSEQGERVTLDRVCALVEIDGRGMECDNWNRLVLVEFLVGFQRSIGVSHTMHRLTHHLATERREPFPHQIVSKMVQRNAIPATLLHCHRNDGIACTRKLNSQSRKRRRLFGSCQQLQRYGSMGHFVIIQSCVKSSVCSTAMRSLSA